MMRSSGRALAAYGQAVQTVAPARQIVMLYDGAIGRLHEAERAIADGRIEDRFHAVRKAGAIIDALHACLDFDRGGEIAPLLDRLYTYVSLRMQQINIRNDASICRELAARLGDLREAWSTIADHRAPAVTAPSQAGSASVAA